jgi:hypothetical protein
MAMPGSSAARGDGSGQENRTGSQRQFGFFRFEQPHRSRPAVREVAVKARKKGQNQQIQTVNAVTVTGPPCVFSLLNSLQSRCKHLELSVRLSIFALGTFADRRLFSGVMDWKNMSLGIPLTAVLPAGIRLDSWPEKASSPPEYDPEVAELRATFNTSLPQLVKLLETSNRMRDIWHLIGSVSGPRQVRLEIERIS